MAPPAFLPHPTPFLISLPHRIAPPPSRIAEPRAATLLRPCRLAPKPQPPIASPPGPEQPCRCISSPPPPGPEVASRMDAARGGGRVKSSRGGGDGDAKEEPRCSWSSDRVRSNRGGGPSTMEDWKSFGDGDAKEQARCGGPGGMVEFSKGGGPGAMEEARVVRLAAMGKKTRGAVLRPMSEASSGHLYATMDDATSSAGVMDEQTGGGSSSGKKRRRPLTLIESSRRDSAWVKREWIRCEQETAEFMKMYPDFVPVISDSDDQLSWDSDKTWVDEESVHESGTSVCPLCKQTVKSSKDGIGSKFDVQEEGGGGDLAMHEEVGGGKLGVQEDGWVTVRKVPARRIGN
ncbi:hypothetical protein EJB05_37054, partial [Eragrostis curvula]